MRVLYATLCLLWTILFATCICYILPYEVPGPLSNLKAALIVLFVFVVYLTPIMIISYLDTEYYLKRLREKDKYD
jgi:hypothetical protein